MRMRPKISDSPAASRNSSMPNDRPLRSWKSQKVTRRAPLRLVPPAPRRLLGHRGDLVHDGVDDPAALPLRAQHVDGPDHLAIPIELRRAAGGPDLRQRRAERLVYPPAITEIALELVDGGADEGGRDPPRLAVSRGPPLVGLLVVADEGLVLRRVDGGGVPADGEDAERRLAERGQDGVVGEHVVAGQRHVLAEPVLLPLLDEADGIGAGKE